ncbi:Hypothetical protein KNT65_gp203 [Escherichia phage EcS1]|uniref:Uncharacterized protein n=1 Tax=Escherichia phage EcS1 TaxID=2083276 RepID=A0A2Z5ZCA7_9CAUD|nr:Hypothetical protein KNT65_gp203 [Escherichia phage EcS1]BBC78290.1 Hypothetical protein [Escherichia phage EcS1]
MAAPRYNSFVSSPERLTKIKNAELRKLMQLGSCIRTPLEKKATFCYIWHLTDGGDMVHRVEYYSPNSDTVDRTFELNEETQIPLRDWYSIMSSVNDYPIFEEEVLERDRKRSIVHAFEQAALRHGRHLSLVNSGRVTGEKVEPFLRETGKILKEAREDLYKELDV